MKQQDEDEYYNKEGLINSKRQPPEDKIQPELKTGNTS